MAPVSSRLDVSHFFLVKHFNKTVQNAPLIELNYNKLTNNDVYNIGVFFIKLLPTIFTA